MILKTALKLLLLITIFACTDNTTAKSNTVANTNLHKARIKTVHGDIIFKFREDKAPATSARIKELIKTGFYNGIVFHRVIPGFVAQAGDPTATGQGGSGKKLKAEFNDLKHKIGTIAMARKGHDINSADSQFYISLGAPTHLDGKYTIFAEVLKGNDIAKKIKQGDKIINMNLE